jgi:hypothetical protein
MVPACDEHVYKHMRSVKLKGIDISVQRQVEPEGDTDERSGAPNCNMMITSTLTHNE